MGLGGAVVSPRVARAQQGAMPVIGFLSTESSGLFAERLIGFRLGLSGAGFVEGRNVSFEYQWAEGRYDRLPALAAELVRRKVALIHTASNDRAALAAKAATSTIPIVFVVGGDPVASKLVNSLSRPGGNLTGVTSLNVELTPKRLELLHELAPAITTIAHLINPANEVTAAIQMRSVQAAARALGLTVVVIKASSESEIDAAFANLVQVQAGMMLVGADPFFTSRADQLAKLALRHSVPAIYHSRTFATAGGLLSYGGSVMDSHRIAGAYSGRILNGEAPSNLAVQQSSKAELIVNLKTAKAFGVTVPLNLLGRADEVME